MKPINIRNIFCSCRCTIHRVAVCVALYEIISSMLLPLTVLGRIGGQYGLLKGIRQEDGSRETIVNLADLSLAAEAFPVILLFLFHLGGFILVIMKSVLGLMVYMFFQSFEIAFHLLWFISVFNGDIKSHTMSQYFLRWYCSFGLVMFLVTTFVYVVAMLRYAREEDKRFEGHDV